jgi:hypothetical protein
VKARLAFAHPETNPGKVAGLAALQAAFRDYVQVCVDQMVAAKRHHVSLPERQAFFAPSTALSSQLQKCARMQAVNTVSTWHAGLWCRLKRRLYQEKHPDGFRVEVRLVALYGLTGPKKCGRVEVTMEAVALWWSWVWDVTVAGRTPVLAVDAPMWLSEMTIEVDPPQAKRGRNEAKLAHRWASVSCLVNGRRLSIPLVCDPKILTAAKVAKSVMVRHRDDGRWCFQFTDEAPETAFVASPRRVAVDVGKNVLAATSDGQLLDRKTSVLFDRRWTSLHRHRRNRQRFGKHLEGMGRAEEGAHLLTHSPRLKRLERSMTGLVRTGAGRVANRLVTCNPDATFVLEDLDLRGCKGRKRFAYRAVQRAIQARAPVLKVHAAYSSQECRKCGHVSHRNRSGARFRCRGCGFLSHADVNAAVNLLGRSEDKQIDIKTHFTKVGVIVRERYRRRRDRSARSATRARTVAPVGHCDGTPSYSGEPDLLVSHD